MGYACPVCASPQRDGEHLAHHLAFTAMLHGDEHEAWLDEHAPDWSERNPSELGDAIVPHAEEVESREVFSETVDRGRPDVGGRGHGAGTPGAAERGGGVDAGGTDPETAAAIREARELTREMYGDGDAASDHATDDDAVDDAADAADDTVDAAEDGDDAAERGDDGADSANDDGDDVDGDDVDGDADSPDDADDAAD